MVSHLCVCIYKLNVKTPGHERMVLKALWYLAGVRIKRRHACTILLTLGWTLNCTLAQTQPCSLGMYPRVKYKGVLAYNNCQSNYIGTYIEHNPPELNGAIVYKLVSSTVSGFIWWRDRFSEKLYVISEELNKPWMGDVAMVATTDRDIRSLTTWNVWCGNAFSTFAMTISTDGATCSQCPENSAALLGAESIADCQCNAGATGPNGGACVQCVAGKYKNSTGSGACTDCLSNEYSSAVGATSNVCQFCAPGGYMRAKLKGILSENTHNCQYSTLGTYLEHNNPAVLNGAVVYKLESSVYTKFMWSRTLNGVTSYVISDVVNNLNPGPNLQVVTSDRDISVLTSWQVNCGIDLGWNQFDNIMTISGDNNACAQCPENSASIYGGGSIATCLCNAGATGPSGGVCVQCVAGKYKNSTGSEACTDCLSNEYSTVVGATSNVCQVCGPNSESAIGSDEITDCICTVGYDRPVGGTCTLKKCGAGSTGPDVGPCVQCVPGKYKGDIGSAECTNCVAGQYSTVVAAVSDMCENCPSNSDSAEASDSPEDCICNAGFSGVGGELCTQCSAGTYSASP